VQYGILTTHAKSFVYTNKRTVYYTSPYTLSSCTDTRLMLKLENVEKVHGLRKLVLTRFGASRKVSKS